MRPASSTLCASASVAAEVVARPALRVRLADWAMLVKPRISVMVLFTVSAGYFLAHPEADRRGMLIHALLGIACVAASSSVLNQWLERHTDARMARTANRPLPAGRLSPAEAVVWGSVLGLFGVLWLGVFVNGLTACLTAATWAAYVGIYTPLKRHTSLGTVLGAIPGAMPPVLGWVAAGGELDQGAMALFAILFFWQFPHFLAIAWIYRDDYARAGLYMLPYGGRPPGVVGSLAVGYSLALIPLSLQPGLCGMAGGWYAGAALLLGLAYLAAAVRFAAAETRSTARTLLWTSLAYLPGLMGILVWDHFRLLS